MARYGSGQVGFLLSGGYDLLGTSTELTIEREAILEETTVLGGADEEHAFVGVKRGRITQNGFYDDAADSSNDAMVGLAERVLVIGLEGNTVGKKFVGFAGAIQHMYSRVMSRGALHRANAEYQANGAIEEGVIIHTHSQETAASGNTEGSSVDNGASSASGGAGYLEISALTLGGYTDVTVKVRDSANDIAYADLVTFANVSAKPTAERKTVTGTVERYLAMSWAFNGAGAGQSIKFMVGFFRN